jgi:phosphatidylglycerol:prolipoprotein diacylglycerol transferase
MIGEILSKFHFFMRDLVNIKILGVEIKSHTFFGYMIGFPITIFLTFIMWKRWKKESQILINFYLTFWIGFFLSYPLYLIFLIIKKQSFPAGIMSVMWLFSLGFSFLYLFFYHRKKLLDFYDHILPFLIFFLHGWIKIFHCFVFGCCFGKPTNLPWGVVFHSESPAGLEYGNIPLHPVQIYNAILLWIIIPPALWLLKRRHFEGEVTLWLCLYLGIIKTFEFYFRGDTTAIYRVWTISIPVLLISLFALIISYYRFLSKRERILQTPFNK